MAPSDSVTTALVNVNCSKLVPIPWVITDVVVALKLPNRNVPCVLLTLKAVVPDWLYPEGYKLHKNVPETKLPPAFT